MNGRKSGLREPNPIRNPLIHCMCVYVCVCVSLSQFSWNRPHLHLLSICSELFIFLKNRKWCPRRCFLFPRLCREKEGGILRRPLLASEALDHPSALALPRDRRLLAPPRGLSLRAEPRGGLDVGARAGEPLTSPSRHYPT